MKVVKRLLTELQRPERNTRMHTDKQLAEFRRSIEKFGQIRPIVIDENNVMLAGNGLYDALISMGRIEADCYVVSGLSDKDKKKLMLTDNRIFDLGVDDMAAFDAIIAELGDDLDVPGFDDELLKSLTASAEEVDNMMAEYGSITEERKDEIRNAAPPIQHSQSEASVRSEHTPATENAACETAESYEAKGEETDRSERRSIICPKCGERLWL